MVTPLHNRRRINRGKSKKLSISFTPAEKEQDEDFENRWSLITHPSQTHAYKPSSAPVSPFHSGFIDASVETLQNFVTNRCGGNGLGSESGVYMDWLADDAFGIVDARTAVDGTILFCVRVAWDRGL
jgi:hypothetical protein